MQSCEHCSKPHNNKTFCSNRCHTDYDKKLKPKPMCKHCGIKRVNLHRNTFCSCSCKSKWFNEQRKTK